MYCPFCSEHDCFEEMTEEEIKEIPKSWTLAQVGPEDKIKRCIECKRFVAINERTGTIVPVGCKGQYA